MAGALQISPHGKETTGERGTNPVDSHCGFDVCSLWLGWEETRSWRVPGHLRVIGRKNNQKTVEGRRSRRGRHRDVDVITGLHLGCSSPAPPTHTLATSTCLRPSGWTSCSAQAGPSSGLPFITQEQKAGFHGLGPLHSGDIYLKYSEHPLFWTKK